MESDKCTHINIYSEWLNADVMQRHILHTQAIKTDKYV